MAVNNDQSLIYLDHNASTPVAPKCSTRCCPTCATSTATPPATTRPAAGGRPPPSISLAPRVAAQVAADPADIIFTSGGTESNNLAIRGTAVATAEGRRRIVTTALEHPATTAPCQHLETQGWTITRLPATPPAQSTPPRRPPRWAPTSPWSR